MNKVQSVRLPKNNYSLEQAEKKVLELGYKTLYRNKKVNQYKAGESVNQWRFRQIAPSKFDEKTFKVKKLKGGVQLIIGKLSTTAG